MTSICHCAVWGTGTSKWFYRCNVSTSGTIMQLDSLCSRR